MDYPPNPQSAIPMYLCLFEDDQVLHLLPLVHTRPVYDLRLGIRTVLETTREAFGSPPTLLHTRPVLAAVAGQSFADYLVNRVPDGLAVLFVNGRYIAEDGPVLERLRRAVQGEPGRVFVQGDTVVAAWVPQATNRLVQTEAITRATFEGMPEEPVEGVRCIGRLWELIGELKPALVRDFRARTKGYRIYEYPHAVIHPSVLLAEGEHIHIGPRSVIKPGAILNAEAGPVYIDADVVVMERAVIRGPAYIGPHTQVKVGASLESCAIGPVCRVGGEVIESVLHSCTNKAHPGFLGQSYLGSWCNLGADTNSSNLKNDYGPVSLHNEYLGTTEDSGLTFLALFMGDHSKSGIDTMFNTGTVVGVSCNLYGSGFHPTFIPSFSWGDPQNRYVPYRLAKALHVAERVMARRNVAFTDADRALLTALYQATDAARTRFVRG